MKRLMSLLMVAGLVFSAGLIGCEKKSDLEKSMEKAGKDADKAAAGAVDSASKALGH